MFHGAPLNQKEAAEAILNAGEYAEAHSDARLQKVPRGGLTDTNRYPFDQARRVKAIELATRLQLEGILSINFLPNAIYRPATCIRATLEAAHEMSFDTSRLSCTAPECASVTS